MQAIKTSNKGFLERVFRLSECNTNVKTEIIAGITTFMTMAYILVVNVNILGETGMDRGAVFTATAISAFIGCLAMGILANYPIALAPGMGLNAFFVYTACITFGLSYADALVLVFFEGIIFILLTITGLRKKIFDSLPMAVRVAIPSGIGLFIALLGLQNAGIVVDNPSTLVDLASFNLLGNTWAEIMPKLVTLFALLAIVIMSIKKMRGAYRHCWWYGYVLSAWVYC
jgi:AGZA family xanthine/uracil permease-like MFS transporter